LCEKVSHQIKNKTHQASCLGEYIFGSKPKVPATSGMAVFISDEKGRV